MLTDNLKEIISGCWSDFQEYKSTSPMILVNPSIPILWFGDIEEYRKSNLKVVTIGLNPSNIEFTKNNKSDEYDISLRFKKASGLQDVLDDNDIRSYYEAMNNYFNIENEPYKRWFNNFERPISALNCSYYPNKTPNRAIHIDIYAPLATTPTWGKLSKQEKQNVEFFEKYFDMILKELNPDIMLISASVTAIFNKFRVKTEDAKHNYIPEDKKNGVFIRVFKLDNKLLISGRNMKGTPFHQPKDSNFIKENMNSIIKQYKIKV